MTKGNVDALVPAYRYEAWTAPAEPKCECPQGRVSRRGAGDDWEPGTQRGACQEGPGQVYAAILHTRRRLR